MCKAQNAANPAGFASILTQPRLKNTVPKSGSSLNALANEAELASGWNLSEVQQGKVGLFSSIVYGMNKEGNFGFQNLPGGADSIEAVPIAGQKQSTAYTPYRPKTWGVAKGAKNVEGAAYFLRYWLDTNNCDMDSTFVNKQFKEVYNIVTKSSHKKMARLSSGVVDYITVGTYSQMCGELAQTTAANITTILSSKKGRVDAAVNRTNKELARMK